MNNLKTIIIIVFFLIFVMYVPCYKCIKLKLVCFSCPLNNNVAYFCFYFLSTMTLNANKNDGGIDKYYAFFFYSKGQLNHDLFSIIFTSSPQSTIKNKTRIQFCLYYIHLISFKLPGYKDNVNMINTLRCIFNSDGKMKKSSTMKNV